MKKQSCTNCVAFDDYANYCMLGNHTTYNIKLVQIKELKATHELKMYYPVERCLKPKSIKELMGFKTDLKYPKVTKRK